MAAIGLLIFILGLAFGSFLNVVIQRMPRGESLFVPASRCPACAHALLWRDNVPLASYLLLRGRCRQCSAPISPRYPVVELLTGLLHLALWWRWTLYEPAGWWFEAAFLASAALLAIAFIDCGTRRIPDALSLALFAAGVAASPWSPYFSGGPAWRAGSSLLGAAAGFALCWAVARLGRALFKREAMGMGDVFLLGGVGAWTGALGAYDCLILAALLGSTVAGVQLLRGRLGRKSKIPFGPFLAAGAIFNLFYLLPLGFPAN